MKKIAILTRRMDIGGVEISLLNFLKKLDPEKFNVTLILTEKAGPLLEQIPEHIRVEEIRFDGPEYRKLTDLDRKLPFLREWKFKFLLRWCKLKLRKTDQPLYYEAMLHSHPESDTQYDLAIDYHGYGYFTTIFMCHKIKAKKYITFIHDDKLDFMENIRSLENRLDHYFCVSKACRDHIAQDYPALSSKLCVFYNIVDIEAIRQKAEASQKEIPERQKNVLVTVGRLEWQKGYDIALGAAKRLQERGVDFHWYIVGSGSWWGRLQEMIESLGLKEQVTMLGASKNPYPYIKRADVYVQASRHEGYGLTVCEAKILCKPIVSTDLPCIREQISHGANGLLCEAEPEQIAESISRLLGDKALCKAFSRELAENSVSFEDQMGKLEAVLQK